MRTGPVAAGGLVVPAGGRVDVAPADGLALGDGLGSGITP
jgi:hypothetical protein